MECKGACNIPVRSNKSIENSKSPEKPIENKPVEDDTENWIDPRVTPEIKNAMRETWLNNDILRKEMDIFLDNINRGLKKATRDACAVKCFPTYVQDLPDGSEVGKYLALDLGGTNFRVLLIELDVGHYNQDSKIYPISQEIMTGSGIALFDHIAACLADFIKERGIEEVLSLGFTFSFPLIQKGLCKGEIERWTKGFNCVDILNQDAVQLLRDAIERRGDISIDVCAVLNDTTGTLIACAWKYPNTRIGLIVGTGNNACYVEEQKNAEYFDEPDMGSGKVIINIEMGAFGNDGALDFIRTEVDRYVDAGTINAGRQLHEKMTSGMYLGESVRCYMLKFTEMGLMFGGQMSDALGEQYKFTTAYISDIESDEKNDFTNTKRVLEELGLPHATEQDYINLRYICECISRRSAHLIAAAMCMLIHKMGEKNICIGVDGSVYKYHPKFRQLMIEKMNELIQPGYTFEIVLSEDGSGRGAALVAAVATKRKLAA